MGRHLTDALHTSRNAIYYGTSYKEDKWFVYLLPAGFSCDGNDTSVIYLINVS